MFLNSVWFLRIMCARARACVSVVMEEIINVVFDLLSGTFHPPLREILREMNEVE
jgi:hypothetical protein